MADAPPLTLADLDELGHKGRANRDQWHSLLAAARAGIAAEALAEALEKILADAGDSRAVDWWKTLQDGHRALLAFRAATSAPEPKS